MPMDRFLIAPFRTGLQTDLRPWLIPDDAFESFFNAYVFRGRVRKRFGSRYTGFGASTSGTQQLFSRLSVPLGGGAGVGTTNGAGTATGTVPGSLFAVGQAFSVGTVVFTVTNSTPGAQQMLRTDGSALAATFDVSNGNYNITAAPINTQVYFYLAQPVMGLTIYENGPINNQPSFAFDTEFAYQFSGGRWIAFNNGSKPQFHGTNIQFFWTTMWQGSTADKIVLFVTNFNAAIGTANATTDDPIWYYDGTNWFPYSYLPNLTENPTNQQPLTVTQTGTNGTIITNYVQQAKIIVVFKGRLILLNTIENNALGATQHDPANPTTTGITPTNYATSTNTAFPQRARFSHFGSPYIAGTPVTSNAFLEPNFTYQPEVGGAILLADGGGFTDAYTKEQIISAEFIKDRLIVYFERSTWELAYTGNEVDPFKWQKINTELGSEATFSTVPFDKQILTMGTTGVHSCNGANVERIDNKIPDEIFEIRQKNLGVERVYGIRDYFVEMVYWTFPDTVEFATETYPNKVLVYNYRNDSWAINEDCITVFGYLDQSPQLTWATWLETWEESLWQWGGGSQQTQFRQVIAGNQEGYVFIIDAENSRNAGVMQITNILNVGNGVQLTIIDHTLNELQYIAIENATGTGGFAIATPTIVQIISIVDANTVVASLPQRAGTYTGGATAARVSQINIFTKQWNPYIQEGRNFFLSRIDFCVLKTTDGQVQLEYYPSSTEVPLAIDGSLNGSSMGTYVLETSPYPANLYPLEQAQERLWHPIYFQSTGEFIQLQITMNSTQMTNPAIVWSDFELEAMILHAQPSSARLQ